MTDSIRKTNKFSMPFPTEYKSLIFILTRGKMMSYLIINAKQVNSM